MTGPAVSVRTNATTGRVDALFGRLRDEHTGRLLPGSVYARAGRVLARSQLYVPVDTGALKASGAILAAGQGVGYTAAVVYTAPHAVWVHEVPAYHAPPTRSHFLLAAAQEEAGAAAGGGGRTMRSGDPGPRAEARAGPVPARAHGGNRTMRSPR